MISARLFLLLSSAVAPALPISASPSAMLPKSAANRPWWSLDTSEALQRAGANRAEIGRALRATPIPQRPAMAFLLANMPSRDLRTLHSKYLLEQVALAFEARASAPWKVYPLIGNLTSNFNLFGDIDANKIFIMGYSHGGYGAFAIGPKIPDHFAAIHASAAAPTDGETSAKTLRNTVFTSMVGEKDLAYDRLSRNQKFAALIEQLRGDRRDIYPVRADIMAGFEHGNLRDHDKIAEMYEHKRNPIPHSLCWEQTDGVIRDFFWLSSLNPAKAREVNAIRDGNRISITTKNEAAGNVLLDARLVDFSLPIEIEVNGVKSRRTVTPSLKTLCDTMARRGDLELAFTTEVPFK